MEPIRVATGTGTGPTTVAAYDAALAAAGAAEYNLVHVSSVIPAGAAVRTVGTLPELGAVGDRLTVVEAAATGDRGAAAALAWGRRPGGPGPDPGPGLFYEASATEDDPEAVGATAGTGLAAGADLRGWDLADRETASASGTADGAAHVAAVAVAAYGSGEPLL
jgi:arginine decarboxylase